MRYVLAVLALIACDGATDGLTETGNPDLEGTVVVAARSSATAEVSLPGEERAAAVPILVTEATLGVERLRLVEGEDCDAPGEVEWDVTTPPTIDLIGAPESLGFEVPATSYCRVRVRLADDGGASVFVAGVRSDGAPFEITSTEDPDIDIRAEGEPFTLAEGRERLLLTLDVARWLDASWLDAAPVVGGLVRIDAETNPVALAAFEAGVEASFELYEDRDGDDLLDEDEAEGELAGSD